MPDAIIVEDVTLSRFAHREAIHFLLVIVGPSCVNIKAPLKSAGGPVQKLVAFPTERDQVGLYIATKAAAPSQVVNIEILGASTFLTAPAITLQDFSTQPGISPRRLSNSRPFLRSGIIHGACFL
jgi:hypothetical protein